MGNVISASPHGFVITMDWKNFRQSDNVEIDCLGKRTKLGHETEAVNKCLAEVHATLAKFDKKFAPDATLEQRMNLHSLIVQGFLEREDRAKPAFARHFADPGKAHDAKHGHVKRDDAKEYQQLTSKFKKSDLQALAHDAMESNRLRQLKP